MVRSFDLPTPPYVAVLALFCSLYSIAVFGAAPVPAVTGPLNVTANSYPFNAAFTTAVPQDLSRYGYVEEEYLVPHGKFTWAK